MRSQFSDQYLGNLSYRSGREDDRARLNFELREDSAMLTEVRADFYLLVTKLKLVTELELVTGTATAQGASCNRGDLRRVGIWVGKLMPENSVQPL